MSIQESLARSREDCFNQDLCVLEISSQYFEPLNVWKLAFPSSPPEYTTIVIFYVPWCDNCKKLHDVFCEVARIATFASFVALNCEKQCKHYGKISHDMPFLVKKFPTIIGYVSQVPFEEFKGERNVCELLEFAGRLATYRDSEK
jgi:thiol-disulfide isomerase/thioredoxin